MSSPGLNNGVAQAGTEPGLLVVGGPMRGGTSLLHHLLNSHPQIRLMALELRAMRYADLFTWGHVAAVHQASISSIDRFTNRRFRRQVRRYLLAVLRGNGLRELTTLDHIHRAFATALADGETRWVGDKYPDYALLYPQFIHRPDTRCLFVYRDVRDVVASIVERVQRGDWRSSRWATRFNTVEKATDYWLSIMRALGDLQRLENNALLIRYEDLVQRTAETLSAIAGHLGVPAGGFDASMVTASSVGRYRERLEPAQVDAILARAGREMETWGYDPGA